MPRLKRPEGVELDWEVVGEEGPLVVLAHQFFGYPAVFEDLIADLTQDHRVIVYDTRGTGRSTRRGPYDMATDIADLAAVITEAGPPAVAVAVAMGDACNRAVKLAAERPDLVPAVVTTVGNPVGRAAASGTEALAGSDSVLQALVGMMDKDYRAALRTMVGTANPQMDEKGARERVNRAVAHCPQEAAVARLHAWIEDDAREEARAIGDRLWILEHGTNPWFPIETLAHTRELLPEAHVEEVPDGPLSRPDLTAAVVRGITAPQRVAQR